MVGARQAMKSAGEAEIKRKVQLGAMEVLGSVADTGVNLGVNSLIYNTAAEYSAKKLGAFTFGEAAKKGAEKAFAETTAEYGAMSATVGLAAFGARVGVDFGTNNENRRARQKRFAMNQ